ncbi:MAG: hypothetical protein AB1611_21260 [bacterium]
MVNFRRSYGKDDTAVLYFSRRDAETQRISFSVILCASASLREIILRAIGCVPSIPI